MTRALLAALALAACAALASCNPTCRSTSDCMEGEHCDFTRSVCKLGCTSDEQCGGTYGGRGCELKTGRCKPLNLPIPFPEDASVDAGTDARTSTSADSGEPRG